MPIFFPNSSPNGTAACTASQSGYKACCLKIKESIYTDQINVVDIKKVAAYCFKFSTRLISRRSKKAGPGEKGDMLLI